MKDICILACGGTIDKDHDPISEKLVFSDRSYVPEILQECRGPELPCKVLMLKDSLKMDDADRETIKDEIQKQSASQIIVTHGTGTMEKTAHFLKGRVGDKTVVLTGAMRPFALRRSDAGFNLGAAILAVQYLSPGVYVCMNGQIFEADNVTKNRGNGFFETLR